MRAWIALVALLLAGPSFAQTCPAAPADPVPRDAVRLNWVRPATYTDGSTITAATVITYTVYERVGTTDTARCTTTSVSAGQTGLSVGAHTWAVSAKVGTGPESAKSNTASKTIPAPTPTAPGNLTADPGDLTAWTIVQSRDRVALVAVGTIAAGTQCDAAQPVLDKWVVPRAAVTFASSVRPEVVLASCS